MSKTTQRCVLAMTKSDHMLLVVRKEKSKLLSFVVQFSEYYYNVHVYRKTTASQSGRNHRYVQPQATSKYMLGLVR